MNLNYGLIIYKKNEEEIVRKEYDSKKENQSNKNSIYDNEDSNRGDNKSNYFQI
jgi:hypothetical protein